MNRNLLLAALAVAGLTGDLLAQGTEAVLKNNSSVQIKLPLELWGVEGPITDLHHQSATFMAQGQSVTIPKTIDGIDVTIGGTSILNNAGNRVPIRAGSIRRLQDFEAHTGDAQLMGATRSLFSLSGGLARDAAVMNTMAANHSALVNGVVGAHTSVLSAARLQAIAEETAAIPAEVTRAANPLAAGPSGSVAGTGYTGGTLKAAGHVYVDAVTGAEYLIPDLDLVVEPAENVLLGTVSSVSLGNGADVPPSFVIGDMLCIMNQDPRFGQELLGFGLLEQTPEAFFTALQPGMAMTAIGYTVGDNVFYAIHVENEELLDPTAEGLVVGVTRWRFDADEVRIDGVTSESAGLTLEVEFRVNGVWSAPDDLGLAPDPAIIGVPGAGAFNYRLRNDPTVPLIDRIRIRAYDADGNRIFNQGYQRAAVDQ